MLRSQGHCISLAPVRRPHVPQSLPRLSCRSHPCSTLQAVGQQTDMADCRIKGVKEQHAYLSGCGWDHIMPL
jgi:hypothetical protein